MRTADRRVPLGRSRWLAAAVAIGVLAIGCGGGPPSAPPVVTPAPTPAPTPVAHLVGPVKADTVYVAMVQAGLRIAPNNASTGGPGHEPIKRINATYEGWPLAISQYSTNASLLADIRWRNGSQPGQGEAPIAIVGLNILIEWGPTTGASPRKPDDRQLAAAEKLAMALDPLVSPLSLRTIVPIPGVSPTPEPTVAPTPKPTPKPSAKATPKPGKATPKPTKKP
jgi:hypothetical protein